MYSRDLIVNIHNNLRYNLSLKFQEKFSKLTDNKLNGLLDCSYYLYDLINMKCKLTDKDFCVLDFSTLRLQIGRADITHIIKVLIELNVIQRGIYVPTVHSYTYSITPEWKITPETIVKRRLRDVKLLNRLMKFRNKEQDTPETIFLYDKLKDISIDIVAAERYIRDTWTDDGIKASEYTSVVNKIYYNDIFCTETKTNGRLSSQITMLKRELRQFLFDKQTGDMTPFVEVDVSNCQILLFILDLISHYPEYKDVKEVQYFKQLALDGKIYDVFNSDRKIVKRYFLEIFLFTMKQTLNESIENNKKGTKEKQIFSDVHKEFKTMFPFIFKLTKLYKRSLSTNDKKGNQLLAIRLQRLESKIMIKGVAMRLTNIGPFATIHDSILCKPEHADYVKSVIEEEFLKELNVKPVVRVK